MGRKIIKFNLNGELKFSKPFQTEDKLLSIREKIKERFDCSFQFIDQDNNPVDCNDENDFTAEDILDGQIIKLKSTEEASSNSNKMKLSILVNEQKKCSMSLEKEMNLSKCRELINKEIKGNFVFLDKDGNKIEEEDEKEFVIEDILNNEEFKLKQDTIDCPPPTPMDTKKEIPKKKEDTPSEKTDKSIKKEIDFSKYEVLEKEDGLTIYKYSSKERQSPQNLVYQYFYDEFNINDYDNAYVILFCGKTGDGKSTAINAFFNIVKGIKLKDNYRFILIIEPKKATGQAESQTDGVHLYYLKDYNNKPVIIIDSQGFGDTRGQKYDEMITKAFEYVFSNVIKHINTACFISKSSNNRLDILTKYIFSSVTSLFSEDITENFIILSTFATKDTIKNGPAFIESIQTDADFLNIQKRGMDEKWWFAFDSKNVLSNDEDKITKYSFSQLNEFYEEKVKKLRPKSIKKCAEVLINRGQLKIQVNLLSDTFQNLLMEQANLQEKEKHIIEVQKQIEEMQKKIRNFEDQSKNLKPGELEKKLEELNQEINDKLSNLNNETIVEYVSSCEPSNYYIYTHCDSCERNCHDYCDCFGNSFGRCKRFTWGIFDDKKCDECGCLKEKHKIDNYHWIKKSVNTKKNNDQQIQEEKDRGERQKQKYMEEINRKKNAKTSLEQKINELNDHKDVLEEEKEKYIKEQNEIKEKIKYTQNQITFIIIKLKNISQKLDDIAMNNKHLKTQDEYIDSLAVKMEQIGLKDEEQKRELKNIKENIRIFKEINQFKENDFMNLDDSQLTEKLKIIIPKSKNSN